MRHPAAQMERSLNESGSNCGRFVNGGNLIHALEIKSYPSQHQMPFLTKKYNAIASPLVSSSPADPPVSETMPISCEEDDQKSVTRILNLEAKPEIFFSHSGAQKSFVEHLFRDLDEGNLPELSTQFLSEDILNRLEDARDISLAKMVCKDWRDAGNKIRSLRIVCLDVYHDRARDNRVDLSSSKSAGSSSGSSTSSSSQAGRSENHFIFKDQVVKIVEPVSEIVQPRIEVEPKLQSKTVPEGENHFGFKDQVVKIVEPVSEIVQPRIEVEPKLQSRTIPEGVNHFVFKDQVVKIVEPMSEIVQLRIEVEPKLQSKTVPEGERRSSTDFWLIDPYFLRLWLPKMGSTLQHLCIDLDYGQQAIMRRSSIIKILSKCCKLLKTLELRNMFFDTNDRDEMNLMASLTWRCVKVVGEALQHINDKMPRGKYECAALIGYAARQWYQVSSIRPMPELVKIRAVNGLNFEHFGKSEMKYREEIVKQILKLGPSDLLFDTSKISDCDRTWEGNLPELPQFLLEDILNRLEDARDISKAKMVCKDSVLQSKTVPEGERRSSTDFWLVDPYFLRLWLPKMGSTLQHLSILDHGHQAIMRRSSVIKILSKFCKLLKTLDLRNMFINTNDRDEMNLMASLTWRCVKVVGEALQHINYKMPKLQTLALLGVFGAEGGNLTFLDMKVLCLGRSTPAKEVVMELPKLEKLQLKMQCPTELIINASILKYVAFNLEVFEPSKVDLRSVSGQALGEWKNVMTETRVGYRGLQNYPEHACVPFGDGMLCVYNTIKHNSVVYDVTDGRRCITLAPPARSGCGDMGFLSTEQLPLEITQWEQLPLDIKGRVIGCCSYEQIFQLKTASKTLKALVESDVTKATIWMEKPTLTACYFFTEDKVLQCGGVDLSSKKWRLLPPLTFLPITWKPDQDSYIENFLVCAKGGLVCINFSESTDKERLIVFNPLSREYRELPAMTYRRNPVLMHMLVDSASQSYQVIVAGSTKSGDEDLSKITEEYDSLTGKWKRMGDVPESGFSLNDYQSGVFQEGKIFCIGYVEADDRQTYRGILGYDVKEGRWSRKWTHPLTFSSNFTILQLLECNGEVYLFSEQSKDRHCTEHWVDRLEWTPGYGDGKKTCELINVIKEEVKTDGWSLEICGPEYTCVPYSDSQLYIFKAYDHTGVVYDIRDQGQSMFALPQEYKVGRERMFNSLYPILFTIEPSFSTEV